LVLYKGLKQQKLPSASHSLKVTGNRATQYTILYIISY